MHETYSLRRTDRLVLIAIATVVWTPAIFIDHGVGLREAAFAQSLQEMTKADAWLIPTIGGQPWVEAPPLTQWLAGATAGIFGISNALIAIRLANLLPAVLATQWTASFAASCSGRRSGVLAGAALLTTLGVAQNIWHGGNVIWLIAAGSGFLNLLVTLETIGNAPGLMSFRSATLNGPGHGNILLILSTFVLLGLVTMIAGTMAALAAFIIPTVGHVLCRRHFRFRPENPWLNGWLLTVGLAAIWPGLIMLNVADSSIVWKQAAQPGGSSYRSFEQLRELVYFSMPWLPLAIFGQWSIRHDAFAGDYSRERLLTLWSLIVPVAVFVLTPDHMEFALAAAGAWSVSAAIGIERLVSRLFHELPALATSHNRTIIRKFVAGCAAVLTLSSVWSDSGSNSSHVDREWLAEVRAVAEQEQPLLIDMQLGNHAAVLLFHLGDLATPLQSDQLQEPMYQNRSVVTFGESIRSSWTLDNETPPGGSSILVSEQQPVIARIRSQYKHTSVRIAADSPGSPF